MDGVCVCLLGIVLFLPGGRYGLFYGCMGATGLAWAFSAVLGGVGMGYGRRQWRGLGCFCWEWVFFACLFCVVLAFLGL